MKPSTKRRQAVIGGIFACLLSWYIIANTSITEDTRFGSGYSIPTTKPKEENRFTHPAGFSIVIPPDWKTESHDSSLIISSGKRKECSSITVTKFQQNDERSIEVDYESLRPSFTKIELNEHPAYWKLLPKEGVYLLVLEFNERGHQWDIRLWYRGKNAARVPEIFWDYTRTFRSEPLSL